MEGDRGSGRRLGFFKYEGLGNDFVIVEADHDDAVSVELVRSLCERRRGIGADGVLLVLPPRSPEAVARMVVLNADGSVPEMCGNGLRCVALHVARRRATPVGTLVFDTDAGPKPCVIDDIDGRGLVTVDMGIVRWTGDVAIDLDGETWELALGDAGNPHAITTRPVTRADIDRVGHRLATHPTFPRGTNVAFTVVRSSAEIDVIVWERGVGITEACGTGACATVAVALAKGWAHAETDIAVRLPGGRLDIRIDARGPAIMRGPARHVFSGELDAP